MTSPSDMPNSDLPLHRTRCGECRQEVDKSEVFGRNHWGEDICEACRETMTYCETCGRWHPDDADFTQAKVSGIIVSVCGVCRETGWKPRRRHPAWHGNKDLDIQMGNAMERDGRDEKRRFDAMMLLRDLRRGAA